MVKPEKYTIVPLFSVLGFLLLLSSSKVRDLGGGSGIWFGRLLFRHYSVNSPCLGEFPLLLLASSATLFFTAFYFLFLPFANLAPKFIMAISLPFLR